jgi:hypothetical protein
MEDEQQPSETPTMTLSEPFEPEEFQSEEQESEIWSQVFYP